MSSKPALPPRPPSSSNIHDSPRQSLSQTSQSQPSSSQQQPTTSITQPTATSIASPSPAIVASNAPPPFPLPPGFTLPSYYHFPPFFTLQPNATTRAKQLKLWVDLLVTYTQATTHPSYTPPPTTTTITATTAPASMRLNAASRCLSLSVSAPTCVLFSHPRINRILSTSMVNAILAAATAADYCCANTANTVVYVLARTVGEWAEAVYGWASEVGAGGAVGGVYTLYELQCGVAASGSAFYGLPLDVLYVVVQRLAQQGRCALIKGDVISETGIKFR